MNERQQFVDKIRVLVSELEEELEKPKMFIKDVEPFMIREAVELLKKTETYLNGYLQVDKERGN
jgi:hypothetical protein